jgi:ribosome-binding protein aMBF1 (putative translation factor)
MIKRAAKARRALTNRALAKRFNLSVNIVNNIASGWEPKRYQRARVDS